MREEEKTAAERLSERMNERNRRMMVIDAFLLLIFLGE